MCDCPCSAPQPWPRPAGSAVGGDVAGCKWDGRRIGYVLTTQLNALRGAISRLFWYTLQVGACCALRSGSAAVHYHPPRRHARRLRHQRLKVWRLHAVAVLPLLRRGSGAAHGTAAPAAGRCNHCAQLPGHLCDHERLNIWKTISELSGSSGEDRVRVLGECRNNGAGYRWLLGFPALGLPLLLGRFGVAEVTARTLSARVMQTSRFSDQIAFTACME